MSNKHNPSRKLNILQELEQAIKKKTNIRQKTR
jgi:hypothetical protein